MLPGHGQSACMPCSGGGSDARCARRYETIIATLCDSLDSLDEPEARAAMVWIIGEYAERIDNADELLESFLEVRLARPGDALSFRSLREETQVLQLSSTVRTGCREHPCLRHLLVAPDVYIRAKSRVHVYCKCCGPRGKGGVWCRRSPRRMRQCNYSW